MKFKKICTGFFSIMFVLLIITMNVKAEDSDLKVVCKTSSNNTYPGETIDVLVYLENYSSQVVKDITTMQITLNLNSDYYTYVENSLTDLSSVSTYEQYYFLNYVSNKNQLQLQFSDLTNILNRNTKDLFKFKVKINDSVPIGSEFDIGPEIASCVDGRQTQIYKISTIIRKSKINVVDISLADADSGLYSSDGNVAQNSSDGNVAQNSSDGNIAQNSSDGNISQNDIGNQSSNIKDNSEVNGSTSESGSNAKDAGSSIINNTINENTTQSVNSINASTDNSNVNNKSNKISIITIVMIVVVSSVIIGLLVSFLLKKRRHKK